MDLRHERAGGVDRTQLASRSVLVYGGRDAMRREDDEFSFGDLGLLLDEDRAALCELLNDVLVVDDLLAHVHGRTVHVERALDGFDRAIDASAIATRSGQANAFGGENR